ncbi:MAG: SDR family NAD(P)-dependent oxidoreductase, partial [Caryophanon sp.]|nr:SDR family NAD(P)-dependent oxidoreductase [Caryophanon sp.]
MARIVAITGASGGLGMAMVQQFVAAGDIVYMLDLSESETAQNVYSIVTDVTDEASTQHAIDTIMKAHGKIDVLINNAGLQHRDKVEDFPVQKWRQLIDVMLTGT